LQESGALIWIKQPGRDIRERLSVAISNNKTRPFIGGRRPWEAMPDLFVFAHFFSKAATHLGMHCDPPAA
jgi:hypothetical protein